jgi:flagellar biosynthesis/type III secretory pathway protein FliH
MTTKRHIGAGAAAIVTALTITVLGAAPAMAADTTATTTEHAQTAQPAAFTQPMSSRDYQRGYQQGYRQAFRDGYQDGRAACRHRVTRHSRVQSQADFQRGFADGYDRGYNSGFNLGCHSHR